MIQISLQKLANAYINDERTACVASQDIVEALLISAVRFYLGYAQSLTFNQNADEAITMATKLTLSEWAIIKPLFNLYVERETATQLEAVRTFGAEVFGRSTSEISAEISQTESEIMRRAFSMPIISFIS